MADEQRPARDSVEGLINRPLFKDDSGGEGLGPTLGSRAPDDSEAAAEASEAAREETEVWPEDEPQGEDEPDLFPDAPGRRKHEHLLGSEIARAGESLSPDVLRGPGPPEDDAPPPDARIARSRPGVAAPDLTVPPKSGRQPDRGL